MAYGTRNDQLRLRAIAEAERTTGSKWLLKKIREEYERLYGDVPPQEVGKNADTDTDSK